MTRKHSHDEAFESKETNQKKSLLSLDGWKGNEKKTPPLHRYAFYIKKARGIRYLVDMTRGQHPPDVDDHMTLKIDGG